MTRSERRELLRKIYAVSTGVHYTPAELAEIYAAYSNGGWEAVRSTIFRHKGIDVGVGEQKAQRTPRPSKHTPRLSEVQGKTYQEPLNEYITSDTDDIDDTDDTNNNRRWIGILLLGSLVGMALL